ncbi:hypothetical protein B0H10DRAFT_1966315 [Mycena sp. CBHHK59/15]|nr:hypothetical protein B0H10DRAFT_1966315 [Mycena sp. CBHHK59/15]
MSNLKSTLSSLPLAFPMLFIVPLHAPPAIPSVKTELCADHRQATVKILNWAIAISGGKKEFVTYSPFTAQQHETVGSDVREEVNKTTLGLYSFRIFVDCVWSAKHVKKGGLPPGHHPFVTLGQLNRKCPLAESIARTAAPKKKRVQIDDQETVNLTTQCLVANTASLWTKHPNNTPRTFKFLKELTLE